MKSWKDVLTKEQLDCRDLEKIVAVTHSGDMHADDVFACGLIKLLWGSENVTTIRTRAMDEMVKGDIVYDVSRQYDGRKYFDHHQKEDPTIVEENGLKHSAFSLLAEAVISDPIVLSEFNRRMAYGIAVRDNGQKDFMNYQSPGMWAGLFNLTYEEEADGLDQDQMFDKAAEFAKELIKRQITQIIAISEAHTEVRKYCEQAIDGKILVLPKYMPYTDALYEYPDIKLVIYKHKSREEWLIAVPPAKGQFDRDRTMLPASWRGYDRTVPWRIPLEPALEQCLFVNSNGFIGSWETADSAIAAAQTAIKECKYQQPTTFRN